MQSAPRRCAVNDASRGYYVYSRLAFDGASHAVGASVKRYQAFRRRRESEAFGKLFFGYYRIDYDKFIATEPDSRQLSYTF